MWRVPEKLEAGECLLSALLREEFLSVTQCWQLTIAHVQGVNLQAERQDVIAADWWSEPQLSAAPACCARRPPPEAPLSSRRSPLQDVLARRLLEKPVGATAALAVRPGL